MTTGYVYEHVVTPKDVTASGIAHDVSYIEWACSAREQMLVDHFYIGETPPPRYLVGEAYMRYVSPAHLNDRVEIRIVIGDHNAAKGYAKLDYRFSRKASGQLIAQGHQIIFFQDRQTDNRVPIPDQFMKLIEVLETET